MKLQPGDLVYYEPNDAVGVLIERRTTGIEPEWVYALRSARRSNLTEYITSVTRAAEEQFLEAIEAGSLRLIRKET